MILVWGVYVVYSVGLEVVGSGYEISISFVLWGGVLWVYYELLVLFFSIMFFVFFGCLLVYIVFGDGV